MILFVLLTLILPLAAAKPADNSPVQSAAQKPAMHGPEAFKLKTDTINRMIDQHCDLLDRIPLNPLFPGNLETINNRPAARERFKKYPLSSAILEGDIRLVKALIEAGASVNQASCKEELPIFLVLRESNWGSPLFVSCPDLIPNLLAHGAIATIKLDNGEGVLDQFPYEYLERGVAPIDGSIEDYSLDGELLTAVDALVKAGAGPTTGNLDNLSKRLVQLHYDKYHKALEEERAKRQAQKQDEKQQEKK